MDERVHQIADNLAQFATDVTSIRTELMLEDKDLVWEVKNELLSLSEYLIEVHHVFSDLIEQDEVEEEDFVLEEEERDATPLETARYLIETDTRSLTEFAADAGMTRDTVKRFLEGTTRPHHNTLRKVELALGLTEGVLDE